MSVGEHACVCVCSCVCIQCRVGGVQNTLCMWGVLKVLKCISYFTQGKAVLSTVPYLLQTDPVHMHRTGSKRATCSVVNGYRAFS